MQMNNNETTVDTYRKTTFICEREILRGLREPHHREYFLRLPALVI